jgi:tRNA(fMet)-specific endonuclease VapC
VRLALDTNRYTDFARGAADVLEVVRRADEIVLPFVVVAELRAGFRAGTLSRANETKLAGFLGESRVLTVWPDEGTTHVYADLFAHLRRAGRPIPTHDLWIAAVCVQHALPLYTRDSHFEHVPGLARL